MVKVEGKENNLLELIAADPAFNMTLEELHNKIRFGYGTPCVTRYPAGGGGWAARSAFCIHGGNARCWRGTDP